MSRRALALLCGVLLTGCAGTVSHTLPAAATAPAGASAPDGMHEAGDPSWPASTAAYRTTSGNIYLGNLDARIDSLRRSVAAGGQAVQRAALAGNLYHRYRIVGRLDDAEDALRQLDLAVAAEPDHGPHRQLRAVVRSGFHRFADALDDLEAAQRAGVAAAALRRTRLEIQVAQGDYAALADELARSAELVADFAELAHRADLRLLQGDLAGASFRYRAAQTQYQDVSPVPLAWLHLQQGIALLRHGRVEDARRFFAAAHERLPQYYLATEHLAECEALLGHHARARELYTQVIAQTGNPEFVAALSGLERAAGNAAEADRLQREAEAGYEELLRRNAGAYAQHAAEFFIEIGRSDRALQLAEANIGLRRDVGSWILLAQAASAAGASQRSCEARRAARATGLAPPEMAEMLARTATCDTMPDPV